MTDTNPSAIPANIAANTRFARELLGYSQAQVAKLVTEAGLTFYPTTVARIERGTRVIRIPEDQLLANALGVPVELLRRSPEEFRRAIPPLALQHELRVAREQAAYWAGRVEEAEQAIRTYTQA
ncbi:MAG: helix-turn-helix transcriptional regulator [Propionibacteriaceae bacterium]|nr:helix-turn-helix transcriptional regulator [Propionibacteriaceae bacterium]